MKTLADLKRDLKVGTQLTLVEFHGTKDSKWINSPRYVIKTSTVDIQLSPDKNATKGSHLNWPKASLLEYDGKTIRIFESGNRPLTEDEKRIYQNQPRDAKQEEIDMLSDGTTMFYRKKRYFESLPGFMHLFGCHRERGMYLKHGTKETIDNGTWSDWFIDDEKVKGKLALVYEIVK